MSKSFKGIPAFQELQNLFDPETKFNVLRREPFAVLATCDDGSCATLHFREDKWVFGDEQTFDELRAIESRF